jgi:hypothetical protein
MKQIIIGCSRNRDCKIGSELIQWWMHTDYSHVYARWHLKAQECDIVYQASHGLVHFQSLENFTKDNIIVKEFILNLTEDQFKNFSKKCIDLCGIEYSTLELFQIFISDLTKGKVKFIDQKGYICSELMAELLEDFFQKKFNKPKFMVEPVDIVNLLSER